VAWNQDRPLIPTIDHGACVVTYSSRTLFFGSRLRVARESRSRRFIYTFTIGIGVWRSTTRGAARGRRLRDSTIRPKNITEAPGARVHPLRRQWLCRVRGRRSLLGRSETVSRVVPMMLHSGLLRVLCYSCDRALASKPSNFTLERTAGSHSLAAAAQRGR
jgi:hypothetical protein